MQVIERPPSGENDKAALVAQPVASGLRAVTISPHCSELVCDGPYRRTRGYLDARFVVAKGAGPGIYNRWVTNSQGMRAHWVRVNQGYLA